MAHSDCTFCDLIGGDGAISAVSSTNLVVSFLDAYPVAPGYAPVVPRRHAGDLAALGVDEGNAALRR